MKMHSKKIICVALICVAFYSCSGPQPANEAASTPATSNNPKVTPATAHKTISDVIEGYLRLKDALVESDAKRTGERAVALLETVDATQMPRIQQHTKEIAAASDNLEKQRLYFDSLSIDLYQRIKESKGNEQMLYKQYCPMAFNNRGAYWLSSNEEIRNPYMGKQMLTCGNTQETLNPAPK